jgi:hypothetical protein
MSRRNPFFAAVVSLVAALLSACGGNSMVGGGGPAPVFSSTPVLQASQGALYTYQLSATDPMGGMVSFELTSAPAGATLNGSTLTWTPAAAESRMPNNFLVTARTSEGGAATQGWVVTPNGTVVLTRVDTRWTAGGSVSVPFDWTMFPAAAAEVAAVIPQADGSFVVLTGTGSSDGTFTIPNVPGGYYWLRTSVGEYWTSQSNFDIGSDLIGPVPTLTNVANTTFDFNLSGLDPIQAQDYFAFVPDIIFNTEFPIRGLLGSTTMTTTSSINTNVDYSKAQTAFLMQFEPLSLGPLNFLTLGPELTLSNISLVNGAVNAITGTLIASPKTSFNLNIEGSSWATLLENVGPGTATAIGSELGVSAEPFVPSSNKFVTPSPLVPQLQLVWYPVSVGVGLVIPQVPTICEDASTSDSDLVGLVTQPPILTDQNFGAIQYEDPFPAAWTHFFTFCQRATVQVPIPNSTSTVQFQVVDGENTLVPTASVAPLVNAVQNATINGASFFTPSTTDNPRITLNWSAPSQGTPFGYYVELFLLETQPDGSTSYFPVRRFGTAKTTATLPFLIAPGKTAIFVISAEVDGRANMESAPRHSALPTAFASIVSAPVTVSAGAQPPPGAGALFFTPQPASDEAETPRAVKRRPR